MSGFWFWITVCAAAWAACCAVFAMVLRMHYRRSSLDPRDWVPFFFVAPLVMAAMTVGMVVLFFGMVVIAIIVIVWSGLGALFGWGNDVSLAYVHENGIALCKRDKTMHRLLPWSELSEWRERDTHPVTSYTAVMKSGEEVLVHWIADDAVEEALDAHGVRRTYDPMCDPPRHDSVKTREEQRVVHR